MRGLEARFQLALVLLLTVFAPAAYADLVTVQVSGQVALIIDPSGRGLPFPVTVGDAMTIEYVFDTAVPATPNGAFESDYFGAITAMTVQVGANGLVMPILFSSSSVENDRPDLGGHYYDSLTYLASGSIAAIGYFATIEMSSQSPFLAPPPTVLASQDAVPAPSMFGSFDMAAMLFEASDPSAGSPGTVLASISSVEVVPEPSAAWMLGSGLAALAVMGRRASCPGSRGKRIAVPRDPASIRDFRFGTTRADPS